MFTKIVQLRGLCACLMHMHELRVMHNRAQGHWL